MSGTSLTSGVWIEVDVAGDKFFLKYANTHSFLLSPVVPDRKKKERRNERMNERMEWNGIYVV